VDLSGVRPARDRLFTGGSTSSTIASIGGSSVNNYSPDGFASVQSVVAGTVIKATRHFR